MRQRRSSTPKPPKVKRLPSLPKLLDRKFSKAGQTRGADDDVIFQNRVARTSTVLIPEDCWELCRNPPTHDLQYENGYIVLLSATQYFANPNITEELAAKGLRLGENALVFYETRAQWNANNPDALGWSVATSRLNPLGGQYVARVPAITAKGGDKINRGFTTRLSKGAGIRVYEYANKSIIAVTKLQLEAFFWLCTDADAVIEKYGMTRENATLRKDAILKAAEEAGLLDYQKLKELRILNPERTTICPLCLERFSAEGFFTRLKQAEGRLVPDITVTTLNLFHIQELRVGVLNHSPYNVGWGHHHCNVVVKDAGIQKTLEWMDSVVVRNRAAGHLT